MKLEDNKYKIWYNSIIKKKVKMINQPVIRKNIILFPDHWEV